MTSNSLPDLRLRYDDFLRSPRYTYADRISNSIDDASSPSSSSNSPRLRIPLSDVRSYDATLSNALLADPLRHLRALETVVHDIGTEERPGYDIKLKGERVRVAIGGPVMGRACSPRELGSGELRRLICVEGVAVKVSSIKPKIVKSVHYCPQTRSHESRTYIDATDPQLNLPAMDPTNSQELPDKLLSITSSSYPTHDKDGNALETEFGLSVYKDHQTITLQEMPERAPMGQLPRSVELVLDHDLVDKVKPGDRVQIVGVYRALATSSQGQSSTSGVFKTVILVNDVKILGRDSHGLVYSPRDVRNIRNLGKRSDILDILGRSVCPSIHGHEVIKKALALQLLGGCEKNLANGTHLRGDINILMVGDPSTAKSQLLRSAMGIAPLAVSTTGKGSSGVGLTAAVTSDPETKERRLEAGAMVLADRGLVCVDEFDKMGENDRVAIHEAMEQQTVTIAKAGMHASLNARCSVLAAANPVYGQYDRKRRIQENIGLPDSLLSRFDLLFVVLDQLDPEADRKIAAHVIRGHMYQGVTKITNQDSDYSDEDTSEEEDAADDEKAHTVWQHSRYDTSASPSKGDDPHSDDVLQHEFLRKYLHFAKTRMKPVLTEEARECIAGRYAEMRSRQDERTLPVTARSLETIIRLASAHAKARLSPVVEADPDVAAAMDILSFALYHENNEVLGESQNALDRKRQREEPITDSSDVEEGGPAEKDPKRQVLETSAVDSSILEVKRSVYAQMSSSSEASIPVEELCEAIDDRELVMQAIQSLEADSKVMLHEGEVYLVD